MVKRRRTAAPPLSPPCKGGARGGRIERKPQRSRAPRRARTHTAYIALGSNLGRRERNVTAALTALEATRGIAVEAVSSLYETAPVGGPPDQPPYINAAARLATTLDPARLLAVMLRIEHSLGRDRRRAVRWGPRTIDLDLLLYDARIIAEPDLVVPHPLMHERRFVLAPLAEIAPDVIHPVLERTARDLLASL